LWSESATGVAHAHFNAHSETAEIDYRVNEQGCLKSVSMPRWGNPEGSKFHYDPCGGVVEKEATFGATPSRFDCASDGILGSGVRIGRGIFSRDDR